MINKRLIREVDSSMKYVRLTVLCQWGMLVLNIALIAAVAMLLEDIIRQESIPAAQAAATIVLALIVIWGRWALCRLSARFSDSASREVKQKLRGASIASCLSWAAAIANTFLPVRSCKSAWKVSISWKHIFPVICRSFSTR